MSAGALLDCAGLAREQWKRLSLMNDPPRDWRIERAPVVSEEQKA